MRLITLTTFTNSVEANIAKSKLESFGIRAFLLHENFINLMPHFSGILNKGIELKVMDQDAEKARSLLEMAPPGSRVCPHCGSARITSTLGKNKASKWTVIVMSLLFFIPFNNIRRKLVCEDCGKEINQ